MIQIPKCQLFQIFHSIMENLVVARKQVGGTKPHLISFPVQSFLLSSSKICISQNANYDWNHVMPLCLWLQANIHLKARFVVEILMSPGVEKKKKKKVSGLQTSSDSDVNIVIHTLIVCKRRMN